MEEMRGGDVLAAGTRLEEFEVKWELGAGGFGVTYLAHDLKLDRQVAIKEYLPYDWATRLPNGVVGPRSATHTEDYRWGLGRFLEEARVLARLHTPHAVQVHRVIEARGTAYMVMEYVEGRSLAEALRAEGPWREAQVLALLDALTDGLSHVHAAGLVHRDIKPSNVMLRGDGSPVLIDFGAARQVVGRRSRSKVTVVVTDGYAPYEQYFTETSGQGPWTDVYALGAVAYEALSSQVPKDARARNRNDTLRPVQEVAEHRVSAKFSAAIMSALALRGPDRPQSVGEWRKLLGLSGSGPSRRGWLAGAAALVLVALAGLVWLLWPPGRVFRDCDICPQMVVIPAGTFMMGSPASEEGRDDDEGPRHEVTLGSFALGVTEVTFDEWEACVRGGGCNGYRPDDAGWGRGSRPVINVNWEDAQAYVRWLSEETGEGYRLPNESEWEYAARGGTMTPFHTGSTISTDQANYDGSEAYGSGSRGMYRRQTTPVGTFASNAFGLYDVHGNVWEWVEDCWHGDYGEAPSDGTAWTLGGDCSSRVLRGGSWIFTPRYVRSASRSRHHSTEFRYILAGFRVSRTLD